MIYFIFFNLLVLIFFNRIKIFYNIYDRPNLIRKIHKKEMPVLGGFILFLNLFLVFFFTIIEPLTGKKIINISSIFINKRDFFSFFFTCTLIFAVGYIDDKFTISPYKKLFLLSFSILNFISINENSIVKDLKFLFFENSIELRNFSILFTFLCILILINAVNMFDGVNLQLGLYSLFLFLVFFFKSYNILFLILILFVIIFLILNFLNKTFLGDSGSLVLGFIFSFFLVSFYNSKHLIVEEVILLTFLPVIEFIRLFFYRFFLGRNPFKADNNHLHHFLLKKFNFSTLILISIILFALPYFSFLFFKSSFIPILVLFLGIYFFLFVLIRKIIIK